MSYSSHILYWINNTKCKNLWPCLKTLPNTLPSIKFSCLLTHFLYSFRALYGENTLRNAVHGSSNKEHVSKTIEMIFGEVEFGPDGSVKEGMCIITITETPFMYTQPLY